MDRKSTVLIYSDRSPYSRAIVDAIGVDAFHLLGITMLNVDNEDVRKFVTEKLKIFAVPTLYVTYYNNQATDVVTGRDAIVNLFRKLLPPPPQQGRNPEEEEEEEEKDNNERFSSNYYPQSLMKADEIDDRRTPPQRKSVMDIAREMTSSREREIGTTTNRRGGFSRL